ncbi:hypothetical protein GT347_06080 [Xylophilus rhododendri]|uniref:Uncharacterized protein n=1 Tax=Xylophilus rhododendri TaxID=2697032 RepID=A0A857J127_9BURK|nr:hypothetical protein [Xylophilus rhododendri]QHI97594.1 hypothetical protein GT347_06080 [Xylophilus rhododendri]
MTGATYAITTSKATDMISLDLFKLDGKARVYSGAIQIRAGSTATGIVIDLRSFNYLIGEPTNQRNPPLLLITSAGQTLLSAPRALFRATHTFAEPYSGKITLCMANGVASGTNIFEVKDFDGTMDPAFDKVHSVRGS